jgi:polysaccharide export outer membrane protein
MKNRIPFKTLQLSLLILGLVTITSCASREDIVYFQGTPTEMEAVNYSPKLQPDDQLVITVSAMDFEATKPFNLTNYYYNSQDPERRLTYLIDENGEIDYPILGKLKLGGMTRSEAIDFMKEQLKEYIINPGVNIEIVNFKITVLGEVTKPGTFTMDDERVTVLEALGLAGDLTINGVRKNVMVIRETPEKKEFYHLDLTSGDIVNSPVYYLKQNDVVYVEPNKAQINSSTYSRNTSIIISVAGLIITVISVLTR